MRGGGEQAGEFEVVVEGVGGGAGRHEGWIIDIINSAVFLLKVVNACV